MTKIAFYVSNNATRLSKFLEQNSKSEIIKSIEFILIDHLNNSKLRAQCQLLGLRFYEVDLGSEKNKNIYISEYFLNRLKQHHVDFGFVFANKILKGELLSVYKNRLINFHPSVLPAFKGLKAIDQALEADAFLLGNSAHLVTPDVDGGHVFMQSLVPTIGFKDYDQVLDQQLPMLLQIIIWIQAGRFRVVNDKVVIDGAKYDSGVFIPCLEFICN